MKGFQQRGVVLVMALMVLATVATLSVYTLEHLDRSTSIALFTESNIQQRQQLLGGEAWALAWLSRNDVLSDKSALLDIDRPWHLQRKLFALEGDNASLEINIVERQTCIDVNRLANAEYAAQAEARLGSLSSYLALSDDWIYFVQDWVDDDQRLSTPSSHEDEFYLGLEIPYRTSNSNITDVSEWDLLPISRNQLTRLAPYICWLPEISAVNVNQLTEPLISAYFPDISEQVKSSLYARLSSSGFAEKSEFLNWAQRNEVMLQDGEWSVGSHFYDVFVVLKHDGQEHYLHTRIERLEDGRVVPFARAFGPFHVLSNVLISSETTTLIQ